MANSIQSVENQLSALLPSSSGSVQSAIKAQLSVLRFCKNANMVDTTFDSILQHLKESIELCSSEREKIEFRKQYACMMQSFIFLLSAQVQYRKDKNNVEKWELLKNAGEALNTSVQSIGALSGATIPSINLCGQQESESLFAQAVNYLSNNQKAKQEEEAFCKSLHSVFEKMVKYQEYVGEDLRLANLAKKYAPDIAYGETRVERERLQIKKWTNKIPYIVLVVFIFIYLFALNINADSASHVEVEGWFNDYNDEAVRSAYMNEGYKWLAIIIAVFAGWRIFETIRYRKALAALNAKQEKIKEELLGYAKQLDII